MSEPLNSNHHYHDLRQRGPLATAALTHNNTPGSEQALSGANNNRNIPPQTSLFDPPHHSAQSTAANPTNSSALPSLSQVTHKTRTAAVSTALLANGAPTPLRAQPFSQHTPQRLNHPLARPPLYPDSRIPSEAPAAFRAGEQPTLGTLANATAPRRSFTSPDLTTGSSSSKSTSLSTASGSMEQHPRSAAIRPSTNQRNPSMDSAMSSVSSATSAVPSILSQGTGHSHHSSSETTVTSNPPPDAGSLAAQAANNPLAVIEKLFKENKGLSSRNEQLWRLVEKQRSMVHGLHADLERALKDKERYRKRLKDYQPEPVPAIPRNVAAANEVKEATQRGQDGRSAALEPSMSLDYSQTNALSPLSPRSPRAVPHQIVASQDSAISALTDDSQTSSYSDDQIANLPPVAIPRSTRQPTQLQGKDLLQQQQRSPATPKATPQKPLSSPNEKLRKAAPAPLNLAQSTHSPPPTDAPNTQASNSDYGDERDEVILYGNLPQFERGRRRTRADDDREREMVALVEEARSRSEKSKKSKSKQKGDEASTPESGALPSPTSTSPAKDATSVPVGLPSSPRAALPPGHIPAGLQPATESIASVLAPSEPARHPPTVAQSVTLPPKSPGLPMSPKPSDRIANAPLPRAPLNGLPSPGPLSPRQGLPLSPRAPKYPIPLPNNAPSSSLPLPGSRQNPDLSITTSMAERIQPKANTSALTSPQESYPREIYRGFVAEQYPGLLLSPSSLSLIIIKVWSSRLRPATHSVSSKSSDDDNVFTLGVHLRSSGKQLWRVEKKPSTLSALDYALRKFVRLKSSPPDRSIFSGHAPAKIDARRAALNRYFEAMLNTNMDDKTSLIVCDYLSKDAIPPEEHADLSSMSDEPNSPASPKTKTRKEGYLAKKGKQFGGWKSRYFILDNSHFKHFDSPGGAPLGIIKLQQAKIASPNAKVDLEEDEEFRHAFTIIEPKRKDSNSTIRHVLCAESDEERDVWVDALMQHIGAPHPFVESPPSSPRAGQVPHSKSQSSFESTTRKQRAQDSIDSQAARDLQAIHYDDTIALDAPKLGTPTSVLAPSPLPDDQSSSSASTSTTQHPSISGPVAGGPIQNASMWGNKSPSPTRAKEKEIKKRSMFGFMRSNLEEPQSAHGGKRGLSPRPPTNPDKRAPTRAVFGAPLADAAEYSQPTGVSICIPSPVYRCIEYLEANDAASEEGIFRLSGSNTLIRHLKERFDAERDVNLVEGPYIDIHAVASLLKLYLRELPDTILTKEKFVDFTKVLEVEEKSKRLAAINLLIHQLPEANREVLVALSRYLIKVVNNSEMNRMTLKNVGIVFAPTLNIPNPLMFMFIGDFDSVFTAAPADPDTASPVLENIATFKAANPDASHISFAESQMQNIAASTGMGSATAQQRINELSQHSPKTSQNSFTEHLAEQRQQLRQVSNMPREGSPSSMRSGGYDLTPMARQTGQSPSSASRSYKTPTPTSRSTPPPQNSEGQSNDQLSGLGHFIPSASSSPSSFVSSLRGRDSPSMTSLSNGNGTASDNYASTNAAAATSRRARRESAMLGNINLSAEPPETARRKSSFNRLKENMGHLREE